MPYDPSILPGRHSNPAPVETALRAYSELTAIFFGTSAALTAFGLGLFRVIDWLMSRV